MKYPFLRLSDVNAPYRDAMVEAMTRVVDSGYYVGGPEVERFEAMLAGMVRAPYAVGVTNGLDALRLILKGYIALGRLAPGDRVMVPANTYVASVLSVSDAGLVPVLCEPDEQTLNLDTARLDEYYTSDVKAVMPVHLYGRVCWDDRLADFVRSHDLIVIEDNAQAIGAVADTDGLFSSRHTGALGHAGAFSFYPTKNIGALGDAGAVVTNDPDLAGAVRALANYGSDRRYHNIYKGYNCRLDPVKAAQLAVKLPHTDEENALRRRRALIYDRFITNPLITRPTFTGGNTHVWHQYVIRCDRRDDLRDYLTSNGVGTDIHYAVPPHRQPCYSEFAGLDLPVTDAIARTVLSLPVSRTTGESDAHAIAAILNCWRG